MKHLFVLLLPVFLVPVHNETNAQFRDFFCSMLKRAFIGMVSSDGILNVASGDLNLYFLFDDFRI